MALVRAIFSEALKCQAIARSYPDEALRALAVKVENLARQTLNPGSREYRKQTAKESFAQSIEAYSQEYADSGHLLPDSFKNHLDQLIQWCGN